MRIALYKNVLSINPKERKGKTKLEVPIHRNNHSFAKNETSLNKNEGRKSFMKTAATFLLMNSLTAEKLTIFWWFSVGKQLINSPEFTWYQERNLVTYPYTEFTEAKILIFFEIFSLWLKGIINLVSTQNFSKN